MASAGTKGEFGLGDINGYTEQYLGALDVRTRNSPNLSAAVTSLRERQRLALDVIQKEQKSKSSRAKMLKWGCAVLGILFIGGWGISIVGMALLSTKMMGSIDFKEEGKKDERKRQDLDKSMKDERDRLKEVSATISEAIAKKDFAQARLLLVGLQWNGQKPGSKFSNGQYFHSEDDQLAAEIKAVEDKRRAFEKLIEDSSGQGK